MIIGKISGARTLDNPDETWCVEAAAVTRSQARKSTESKPLKVGEATNQMAVTKDKLIQLQGEDPSPSKYMTKEAPLVRNGKEISHAKRKRILYRITKKIYVEKGDKARTGNDEKDLKIAANAEMLMNEEIPSIDEDSLLELGTYKQKEDVSDVKLETELDDSQSRHCKP